MLSVSLNTVGSTQQWVLATFSCQAVEVDPCHPLFAVSQTGTAFGIQPVPPPMMVRGLAFVSQAVMHTVVQNKAFLQSTQKERCQVSVAWYQHPHRATAGHPSLSRLLPLVVIISPQDNKYLCYLLAGSCVHYLVGSLANWFVCSLIDRLVHLFIDQLVGELIQQLVGVFVSSLVG